MRVLAVLGASVLSFGIAPDAAAADEPQRRLDIDASIFTSYETNVLRRAPIAGLPVNGVPEDYRTAPSLTFDLELPIGRQSLIVAGTTGYDFYARNKQLNRERIDVLGGVVLRGGRACSARATAQFARQQSDLADLDATTRLVNTQERRAVEATLACKPAFGLSPSLSYLSERTRNSDPGRQRGNFSAETFSASLGFVRPSFGKLSLFTTYKRGRYPNRISMTAVPASDRITLYSAGASFSRAIGSRLQGQLSLGYTVVNPNLAGVPRFSGLSGSADLTFSPSDRIRLQLTASRAVQQSNLLDVSYSIVDTVALSSEYRAGPTLAFVASGTYAKRSLRESPLATVPLGREGDRTYRLSGGVRLTPPGRLGFALDLSREQRKSGIAAFNFSAFVAAVSARIRL